MGSDRFLLLGRRNEPLWKLPDLLDLAGSGSSQSEEQWQGLEDLPQNGGVMDQANARRVAQELSEFTGQVWIADTVCKYRGEHEQGPDAYNWGVRRNYAGATLWTTEDEARQPMRGKGSR